MPDPNQTIIPESMIDRILDVMQTRGLLADESDAKAVIQAMREPTRPMWAHAGTMFVNCQGRELHHDRVCGLVWDAMLAAALEPELANG